jgi:hypothetical protein
MKRRRATAVPTEERRARRSIAWEVAYFTAGAGDACSALRFAALCRGAVFLAFFSECFFSVFVEPSAWVLVFVSDLLSDLVAGAAVVLVSLPLAGA